MGVVEPVVSPRCGSLIGAQQSQGRHRNSRLGPLEVYGWRPPTGRSTVRNVRSPSVTQCALSTRLGETVDVTGLWEVFDEFLTQRGSTATERESASNGGGNCKHSFPGRPVLLLPIEWRAFSSE